MSLLRIYGSLLDEPERCQWVLLDERSQSVAGAGRLTDLPQRARHVHFLIPAAQVLIARTRVPPGARRHAGPVLAFAVEEQTAGEPDANQVSWLGSIADEDALAVVDKQGLTRWKNALAATGIRIDEVHCETLLLPVEAGEWSLAWNGREGFVRSGRFTGAATDCGDRKSPPLVLRLMLEEARAHRAAPASIALYPTLPDAAPDLAAWQDELGVELRLAGAWDWRNAPSAAGISLVQQQARWHFSPGTFVRLRPAAWLLAAALALHAIALSADWTLLAGEQRALRQQMALRFRAIFPEAVAVADPALQMRRKLAEARHRAGVSDSGDFLPLIERVAPVLKALPAGALRAVSYDGGALTLALAANQAAALQRIVLRLREAGLSVDQGTTAKAAPVLIVRAS